VRYTCTIYSHDCTIGGAKGFTGSDPVFDSPTAYVVVSGRSLRDAAARAYVKCIGRERARQMRQTLHAPREVIQQETSCKAIAASLRKTARRIGECYELDNFVEAWSIKVEPLASPCPSSPRLNALRLPSPLLWRLSANPSPN
jgi:hypothetical protein